MRILANVATKDSFDPDLTLEQDDAFTLSFVVANASAIVRLRAGRRQSGGDNSYGPELLLTPQTSAIQNVSGAQFRSAIAGAPARVIAQLTGPGDPQIIGGIPFLETLSAQGQLVTSKMNPYTPQWASGNNPQPVLGNGVLSGRFVSVGAVVLAAIDLVIGSTTQLGTGAWFFSLPTTVIAGLRFMGEGFAADTSAGQFYGVVWQEDGAIHTYQSPAGFVNPALPFAWAVNDHLSLNIVYGLA